MGNSSSKSPSASYISNPGPLKGLDDKSSEGVHRRATAHASSHPALSLQVPSSGTHRRSRSAIVQGVRPGSQAPPPSYQEALSNPVNSPVDSNLLNIPTPQNHHRSHSQDARRSRNPFIQRPVSYNGAAQGSLAGGNLSSSSSDSPAVSWSISAPAPSRSASSAAPKWTTDEERLAYLRRPLRQESFEDALEILRKYDTVIVVDDSSSMTKDDRWSEARSALAALAEAAATYDADGIDVCFLNSQKEGKRMKSAAQVQRLFNSVSPHGLTPIGDKLDRLLRGYINELENAKRAGREDSVKPINYIVLTDGAATDDPAEVIVNAARRLDNGGYLLSQLGIQFVQIGTDRNATQFLRQLDDDIAGLQGVRDIVDTTPYLGGHLNAETLIKILLGGINRRVDRKGGRSVMSG
ncbi:hypothetical protein BD309DRAFT_898060 [Dichomitus squalens]|uniref:Uncharacterized protein n=1 Tax=Dichomitus squalens TaxID=114155 RepID=A0A4Q9Q6U5_9APHY|nr:hypothetical protein BD309DRAFT_898060 [Dichomitus squalens]TBU63217.1 hypothetical protein BD310DRAFT_869868 [Dichomitus squalens]